MSFFHEMKKRVLEENPIFGLMLGLCPTLAVTTSLKNAVGMGIAAGVVLICSNIVISAIRKIVPSTVRIPVFIVVIASFVTMVDLSMEAYFPELHKSLGLFIPLIVVNCIILGRAEAFASKNDVLSSALDGLGMTIGFTAALSLLGGIREVLGAGSLWGVPVGALIPGCSSAAAAIGLRPAILMILPPGAFIVMGLLMGYFQYRRGDGGCTC